MRRLPIARRQPRHPRFVDRAAGEAVHPLAERPQNGQDGASLERVEQPAAGGLGDIRRRARRRPQAALGIDIGGRSRRAQSEPRFGLDELAGVHGDSIADFDAEGIF